MGRAEIESRIDLLTGRQKAVRYVSQRKKPA
ncbi:conserved hypothetical protein [Pseudomonas sp. 8Z]|nr:conserved hypothetical protein [Pseudomonas sp. 8Z]